MIGNTMNASSRPLSSQVMTPNQPIGQLRACRAGLVCHLVIVPPGSRWRLGGTAGPVSYPPEAGHCVVSDCSEAGTLAWGLARAGEMTTNPLLRMIA